MLFASECFFMPTHEVSNQAPALVGYNLFACDPVLGEALQREGAAWAIDRAHKLGQILGSEETIDWGFAANANPPVLQTHDCADAASIACSFILPTTS